MSTELSAPTPIESSMLRLDEIASNSALITSGGNPFTQAISMANAIIDIRRALTDEVMEKAIIPLMNSKLGFRTDKDPTRPAWNKRSGRMEAPEPYPIATVRECLIEATLRGVPLVGNCWNIIAGQSYITKEGFWYLIGKKIEGLTDFKVSVGVPRMIKAAGDARNASDEDAKGAIVPCFATWKLNAVADRVEREIPIRVNAMMGADAIMGKAERKLLAAAYAQITGTTPGDADASETEPAFRDVTPRTTDSTPKGTVNPFEDSGKSNIGATESKYVNEADERASRMSEIKSMLADENSSINQFAPKCREAGLLGEGVQFHDMPIEALRIVHEDRLAIHQGTFGKEGA